MLNFFNVYTVFLNRTIHDMIHDSKF